jgi:hypothetical protein
MTSLEAAGLLSTGSRSGWGALGGGGGGGGVAWAWAPLKKGLRLLSPVEEDADEPADYSFVTMGYAPLSVRLVERALAPEGWASIAKELACIPGGCREVKQRAGRDSKEDADEGSRKVVLVCFVGGVTHAEISSLRFLSERSASSHTTPRPLRCRDKTT